MYRERVSLQKCTASLHPLTGVKLLGTSKFNFATRLYHPEGRYAQQILTLWDTCTYLLNQK